MACTSQTHTDPSPGDSGHNLTGVKMERTVETMRIIRGLDWRSDFLTLHQFLLQYLPVMVGYLAVVTLIYVISTGVSRRHFSFLHRVIIGFWDLSFLGALVMAGGTLLTVDWHNLLPPRTPPSSIEPQPPPHAFTTLLQRAAFLSSASAHLPQNDSTLVLHQRVVTPPQPLPCSQ